MIIPSIDLMGGQTVQLVGGREHALDAGDPLPIAARFSVAGEIAVVDLDAALGRGDNAALVTSLCASFACRVGGGIRDYEAARRWLDRDARRIVLGTAADPALLRRLPRERVVVALDAVEDEVVVEGWQTRTGRNVGDAMRELRPFAGGFLVTFVEREGRLGGTRLDRARELCALAGDARLTVAGGVTTADEVAELDRMGADAQVGMALYTGALDLGDAVAAPLRSDRADGLFPTVVCDEAGRALGLCYSSRDSIRAAVASRRGVYHSRRRGLWQKGETSGATQALVRVELDCDRDALRFVVRQAPPGFCHLGTDGCWGPHAGLAALEQRIAARARAPGAPTGSYTRRLLGDPELLGAKLAEEAGELAGARGRRDVSSEAADLFYFAMVAMARAGVTLDEVERELDRRALAIERRPGDAKPAAEAAAPRPAREHAPVRLRRIAPADLPRLEREPVDPATRAAAAAIVAEVRAGGDAALRRHAERFGELAAGAPLVLGRDALAEALADLDAADRALFERTADRIRRFAEAQRACFAPLTTTVPGGRAGHRLVPIERAGCYAPGGGHPLPSSVLMTVVPARVAGVSQVWVASPRPTAATLAAAAVAGADALLSAGGAHAVAALAYGTESVPAADVVVGPGSRWVTAAKAIVFGHVGIDMLAGPSELVVLADETADAALVAADLLAQAEHATDALPVLVTTSAALVPAVEHELERQLATLPTALVARAALENGFAVVAADVDEAVAVADRLAPEHLQLAVADAASLAPRLGHHGALFLGAGAAEVLADYGIGPNHVLPTGGGARHTGGLSVLSFLRVRTWLGIDDPAGAADTARDAARLARIEGLEAHARSADRRAR
jgi:histidinol dehydrogenase/phosphoribosyl-ATP pyrophosphohydrolase